MIHLRKKDERGKIKFAFFSFRNNQLLAVETILRDCQTMAYSSKNAVSLPYRDRAFEMLTIFEKMPNELLILL